LKTTFPSKKNLGRENCLKQSTFTHTSVYLYQEIHTYQGMNITGVTGLTATVATLKSLGQ
jgi:hypothetical protein